MPPKLFFYHKEGARPCGGLHERKDGQKTSFSLLTWLLSVCWHGPSCYLLVGQRTGCWLAHILLVWVVWIGFHYRLGGCGYEPCLKHDPHITTSHCYSRTVKCNFIVRKPRFQSIKHKVQRWTDFYSKRKREARVSLREETAGSSLPWGKSLSCHPVVCRREPGLWAPGWGCPVRESAVCSAGTWQWSHSSTPPSGGKNTLSTSYLSVCKWDKDWLVLTSQTQIRGGVPIRSTTYLLYSMKTAGLCWNSSFKLLWEQFI